MTSDATNRDAMSAPVKKPAKITDHFVLVGAAMALIGAQLGQSHLQLLWPIAQQAGVANAIHFISSCLIQVGCVMAPAFHYKQMGNGKR